MALHYNLSKVYSDASNNDEFADQTLKLFVSEAENELFVLKNLIEDKNFTLVEQLAINYQPKLEMLGMTLAFEEVVVIRLWANRCGKRKEIKETYKSLENRIEKAIKEIRKDFKL